MEGGGAYWNRGSYKKKKCVCVCVSGEGGGGASYTVKREHLLD